MVKSSVFTLWILLPIRVQVGAAPTISQLPLHKHGATTLMAYQSDNINADGQVNVMFTEASLFGHILSPLTREDVETLEQYSAELEGDAIVDALHPSDHHSDVFGLYSIIAKIVDGMGATRKILHDAFLKVSSLRRLPPLAHQIEKSSPCMVESDGDGSVVEQAFQDDAHYPADDLRENQFDNTAKVRLFDRLVSGLIRSHIHSSSSEQVGEVSTVDAPSDVEDTTDS